MIASATFAAAQDTKPADPMPPIAQSQDAKPVVETRPNMLKMLGLTREQLQQIRKLNLERKPLMEEAQKRFRESNQALNEAIYSDQSSDTDVIARLKEAQLAQAEVIKIRSMNELAVRRVLTSEQLTKFRELRRRFDQTRENAANRPVVNKSAPVETNAKPGTLKPQRLPAFIRQNGKKPKP